MITSTANDRVKYARSLRRRRQRGREGKFLIEGVRLLEEAMRAGCFPALLFFDAERVESERAQPLLDRLQGRGVPCLAVSDAVLDSLSETVSPQPIVAVVPQPQMESPTAPSLLLVLDGLRDPGNLGAVLRTAVAAGVDEVLLARGTVDPYNPKVVRAAMGAHFRLPLVYGLDWEAIGRRLGGLAVWLADAQGDRSYDAVDWRRPAALIVGGEAKGPGGEAVSLAGGRVRIPMCGDTESLNAAVATAVILFEAARQRRAPQAAN
jgi:TrmH family RNA methyltransferase